METIELGFPVEPAVGVATGAQRRPVGLSLEDASARDRLLREGSLLVLASLVIGASFAFAPLKSRGLVPAIPCLFYKVTGLPCLTCGLTRSFALTAGGNISGAFGMHLLGPPLFFLTSAVAAYLATVLVTGKRVRVELSRGARRLAFWGVLGIFFACWALKVAFMMGSF